MRRTVRKQATITISFAAGCRGHFWLSLNDLRAGLRNFGWNWGHVAAFRVDLEAFVRAMSVQKILASVPQRYT
eukprot:457898-Rhodomonas_salina.3